MIDTLESSGRPSTLFCPNDDAVRLYFSTSGVDENDIVLLQHFTTNDKRHGKVYTSLSNGQKFVMKAPKPGLQKVRGTFLREVSLISI